MSSKPHRLSICEEQTKLCEELDELVEYSLGQNTQINRFSDFQLPSKRKSTHKMLFSLGKLSVWAIFVQIIDYF